MVIIHVLIFGVISVQMFLKFPVNNINSIFLGITILASYIEYHFIVMSQTLRSAWTGALPGGRMFHLIALHILHAI